MPRPTTPSGRFILRTNTTVDAALREAARAAGVSVNDSNPGEVPGPGLARSPDAMAITLWASEVLGDAVIGLVVHGAWARGEAAPDSDVELLAVLDASRPLTAELHRRCEGAGLSWQGHPVRVQVVHLPPRGQNGGPLWPGVALDGIVLAERDFEVSRRLVALRRSGMSPAAAGAG